MPSILIIEDHAIARRGIRQTLQDEIRGIVFGEARNGREAMLQVAKRQWDLIILDVSLPDRDGFSLLRQITEQHPRAKVLLLGIRSESLYITQARQLGACGYLSKRAALGRFVAAVRAVLGGKQYFGGVAAEHEQLRGPRPPLHVALSVREREVMLGLAAGKSVTEIAEALSLSVKTVSTFKRRVMNKLGAGSVADIVRYVIEHGL